MGLDQGIRRLSRENAALLDAQFAKEEGGSDYPFPYEEIEMLWEGRKENHIHAFVERVTGELKGWDYRRLEKSNFENLILALQTVIADHSMAPTVLPTSSGFFFGSTDYDEWYFSDLERELTAFQGIVDNWDDTKVYYYWCWW